MDTRAVNRRVFAVMACIEFVMTERRNFAQRKFRREFIIPVGRNVPSRNSISDWYRKFQNTDNVLTTYVQRSPCKNSRKRRTNAESSAIEFTARYNRAERIRQNFSKNFT